MFIHKAQGFDRDGRKEAFASNAGIFFIFVRSGKLRCSICLAGGPSDVGFSQWTRDSYVPAQ